MNTAKRVLAVFLVGTGVAVALNLILTPVYHDGSPDYPSWQVLNWFMAAGVIAVLAASYVRRRGTGSGEASTLEAVLGSMTYYGAIVLTMLFFWEWFWTLNPDSETGEAVTSHLVYFPLVDALYVVLALATGTRLWSNGGETRA